MKPLPARGPSAEVTLYTTHRRESFDLHDLTPFASGEISGVNDDGERITIIPGADASLVIRYRKNK